MSDNGFILMLAFGTALLIGILTVTHVSAFRLRQRLQLRRQAGALAPDMSSVTDPELDFGSWYGDPEAKTVSVKVRHAETAR